MSGWSHSRAPSGAGVFIFTRALSVLFVLSVLLTGCAKHEPVAAGQVLRIAQRNEPATLDPQRATLPDEFFIIRALSEGLLTPALVGAPPLPGAAEKWEVSPDGLTYTFHLRADAKWSNGDPVTAADFVYSIRRAMDPATAAPKAGLFAHVREPRAPDPRTLVILLKQPANDFPALVASGPWIPVHRASLDKPGGYIGNGPFTLAEWRPNQRIVVQKNPLYHDAAALRLDAIQFLAFDSGDTEERAFRAGQVDVTLGVPITKLAGYDTANPAVLESAALHETRYLVLNTARPPLNDVRVRRALSLALDRTALTDRVLQGGQQPAFSFIPTGLGGYASQELLTENAGEARRLLAEAGFPEGRGFPKLELATWPVNTAPLEAIQQMWRRELGIDVRLAPHEARTHLATLAAGDFTLAFMTAIPDFDGASDLFDRLRTGSPDNYPHWSSAEFDRLTAEAGRLDSADARNNAYRLAEKVLLAEMPVIPVYFNNQNYLISPAVQGWHTDRLWTRFYRNLSLK